MNHPLPPEVRERRRRQQLSLLQRRFHIAAFGEEMARVNLDFTKAQRRQYLDDMRKLARRKGVPDEPSYHVGWMLEVEAEVRAELAAESHPTPRPLCL